MLKVTYKGLTHKGANKLRSIRVLVPRVALLSLRKNFGPTRNAIISLAPTPANEAIELSRGLAVGGLVGDPGSGRFSKTGAQRSVQAALAEERPIVGSIGGAMYLKWGNTAVINTKIGFSWVTTRGQVRSTNITQALWGNLIQAWEGSVAGTARITSRGSYPLRPEDRVFAPFVDKAVPAYHMVRRGYNSTRIAYQSAVRGDIKTAVRRVGLI